MNNDIIKYYEKMYKIRCFEEMLLKLFSENKLQGTTHTSIGQEANAVAVMNNIRDADFVFSSHRCHGQFIAYSDDIKTLLSEIMGKQTGMCKGRGGSQHICYRHFYTNGVQGGIIPNATGMALANKMNGKRDSVVVAFLGDGTLGQGVVYESFNLAALYNIPILYVVEDNGYAMSTKTQEGVAGSMTARAEAFGIKTGEITSNDVMTLNQEMAEAFRYVRTTGKPFCQVIHTYRLGPHSKGDDFRDLNEITEWRKKDPLKLAESKMDREIVFKINQTVEEELQEAILYAQQAQVETSEGIYAEEWSAGETGSLLNHENIRCVESLNAGLSGAMQNCDSIVLIGEDIRDPYGGAFKVTKGLTAQYPDRIMNTPISEAGVLGLSIGMAMGGIKPVVEIMFGDFITLGFDQLLNHAVKYNWMYAGQVNIPVLIRIPMGGGRGYGPTHSQSLEKYLVGMPNLRVLAFSKIHNVGALVCKILNGINAPVILIENKKMYGEKLYIEKAGKINMFYVVESEDTFPVYRLTLDEEESPDVTIITYGSGVDIAMEAAIELMMGDELLVNIIVHTCLSPLNTEAMVEYIGDCKNIVSLEEGTLRNGWGAEIIAQLAEKLYGCRYKRIAAENCVIPCGAELERKVLPDKDKIVREVRRMKNE